MCRLQFNMFCVCICICGSLIGCTAAWGWVWPLPPSRAEDKNRWSYASSPSTRLWVLRSDNLILRVLARRLTWKLIAAYPIFKWRMFLHCESSLMSFLSAGCATLFLYKRLSVRNVLHPEDMFSWQIVHDVTYFLCFFFFGHRFYIYLASNFVSFVYFWATCSLKQA